MQRHYDLLVIGSGQGGKPLALAMAAAGRRVAVVERGAVGGSCVNYGCTPTKTMAASARVAWLCRRSADFGVLVGTVVVDLRAIRERKDEVVASFRSGSETALEDAERVELVHGEAAFVGERRVRVQNGAAPVELSAEVVVIDTGLAPDRPDVDGLDAVPALDSTSILELEQLPRHLLVVGGGYIGVEYAQMFRRFGSEVTLVENGPHLLGEEDEDIAGAVTEVLRGERIRILTGTAVRRARRSDSGLELDVDGPAGAETLAGSHLLVATGGRPQTAALQPQAAGIDTDEHGFIRVDERLRTSADAVYALGDVKGGPAFTHVAWHDHLLIKRQLLEGDGAVSTRDRPLVYTVFTDPQLGRVGLSEREARRHGRDFRIARLPMQKVARAIESGDTRGVMKVLVERGTDRILGAAIFGLQGGEVMSMLQIAMLGGLRYQQLRDGMFAHPLLAEALNTLFAGLED